MEYSVVCWILFGVVMGYSVGWHRGVLRLPFLPRIRGARYRRSTSSPSTLGTSGQAPSGSPEEEPGSPSSLIDTAANRDKISADLRMKRPDLTSAQIDGAVEQIVAEGRRLFPGRH